MCLKYSRTKIAFDALLTLFLLLLAVATFAERIESEQFEKTDKPAQIVQVRPTTPAVKSDVLLYFASKNNGFLVAENRMISNPANPVMFAKNIIQALINGPRTRLMRTLPQDMKLRALYVTGDGTAYTDFSVAIKDNHPGGIQAELITIYSIVNSLVLNITGIDRVKFLIEGHESLTLAGHIDLQNPFTAEMLLIR